MKFNSMDQLKLWLSINKIYNFDGGSQGECYKIGTRVYKVFIQYIEEDYLYNEYSKEDILRFSSIKNNTYIWPVDTITVGDIVVGYITDYVRAKSLFKINPLLISLNKLEKSMDKVDNDIKIISKNGVLSYDVCYNILYGRTGFKIIDTLEYSKLHDDFDKIYIKNKNNFSYEVKLFLVDNFFNNVVEDNLILNEMYRDVNVSSIDFLREFRKIVSEIEGYDILKLGDAKKSICRQRKIPKYIRNLC